MNSFTRFIHHSSSFKKVARLFKRHTLTFIRENPEHAEYEMNPELQTEYYCNPEFT